jgi:hypothetical protein
VWYEFGRPEFYEEIFVLCSGGARHCKQACHAGDGKNWLHLFSSTVLNQVQMMTWSAKRYVFRFESHPAVI